MLASESGGTGFGIYAFHFRLEEVLNSLDKKTLPIERIMIGDYDEKSSVKRVFNFPSRSRDMFLPADQKGNVNKALLTQAAARLKTSRLTVSIVNDVFDELIEAGNGIDDPYLFLGTLNHTARSVEDLHQHYVSILETLNTNPPLNRQRSFKSLNVKFKDYFKKLSEFAIEENGAVGDAAQEMFMARSFGLRPENIGLLLDIKSSPTEQEQLRHLERFSSRELEALTGSPDQGNGLAEIQKGEIYVTYMHTLYANLQFIQTLTQARPKQQMTMVMKMQGDEFYEPLVQDALRQVQVSKVTYWSEQSGYRLYKTGYEGSDGIELRVVNIFPANENALHALAYFSQPVVGTTRRTIPVSRAVDG